MKQALVTMEHLFDRCVPDPTTGCWLWTHSLTKWGYGNVQFRGKVRPAHRVAWMLANGSDPGELLVLHRCDTPACCNPSHLFLGTNAVNMADMVAKNRQATGDRNGGFGDKHWTRQHPERRLRGERNNLVKLSDAQVVEIRRRRNETGMPYQKIADEFGVSANCVSYIVRGINRKHVVAQ